MKDQVLLTGATGLLGQAVTVDLLERGYGVLAMARNEDRFAELQAKAGSRADQLRPIWFEYEGTGLGTVMDQLEDTPVTHLVNNARALAGLKVQDDGTTDAAVFTDELGLNIVFPYELTVALAAACPTLRTVVNVGSMYGIVAPNPALYNGTLMDSPIQYGVAKAGLHHMSKELAVRLAPDGIRVNAIAYGGIQGRVDAAFLDRYAALTPSRRMLQLSEVTGPMAFLLSDESSAVTGHVLTADGGWSIW